jgi:chloramphenicol-sensitive protein RarD
MPLYFAALAAVPPVELVAHRVVWSVVVLAGLLTWLGRWKDVRACLSRGRTFVLLLVGSVLIAVNWFAFIYAVVTGQTLQSSLGYFITPLLSIVLGVLVFRERLNAWRWGAVGLAGLGLAYLVGKHGGAPWIALTLALSFGLYGLLRKVVAVDGLVGLAVETLLLTPAATAVLAVWLWQGTATLGRLGWRLDALLLLSGVITAIPLLCFGEAARRLPLSTLGFLQYLGPSLQFVLAVAYFGETFRPELQVCFACTWTALLIVTIDSLRAQRRRSAVLGAEARAQREPAPTAEGWEGS